MQARYLIDWMEAVELEPALLVAHDLGGGAAQAVRRRAVPSGIYHARAVVRANAA